MNRQKISQAELLNALPFLEGYSKAGAEEFLSQSVYSRIPKGKIISTEGDSCSNFSFVLNGSIKVYKIADNGREITLYYLNKGDSCILTASCILSKKKFPAISQAEVDTEVLTIPAEILLEWVDKYEHWRSYVFGLLSNRLADIITIVEEIIFRNVDKRLVNYLLKNAKPGHKEILKTHYAIASDIGTSREVVSRLLKEFEDSNLITLSRKSITILDSKALEEKLKK
ncbi:Crp/Fnr family transcriptional regulator [Ignavibacterium sp.]|uniref:Crp/Fnr family transcriptional regulator n=1 Tax=Ignavibacterium sp. TaxID=2651167 RepID=UPI0021FD1438|nr:Crp/Fnr family transcriptional regulator [Ignavibacterium sp.]BDQ04055.1 MAG: cyclic nucleotide-binding protein [Ignavibacterium sp.]